MAPPTPTQTAWRARIEAGLPIAAPFLDVLLAVRHRASLAVDREGLDAAAIAGSVASVPVARCVGTGARA